MRRFIFCIPMKDLLKKMIPSFFLIFLGASIFSHSAIESSDKKSDESIKKGNAIFAANCSPCHQADGKGKAGLAPSIRNRDFLAIASDKFISDTITKGRAGTSMIPRPDLKGEQVQHIINWLRSIDIKNPITINVDPKKKVKGDNNKGAEKYKLYCAYCHGENGEGYSSGGAGPGIGLKGFLDIASDDFIYQTVKQGRMGTAMKSFLGPEGVANLTEQDINDIICHLRKPGKISNAVITEEVTKSAPVIDKKDLIEKGKNVFMANCSPCHQADGKGKAGLAPSIRNRDFLALSSDKFISETIKKGRPGTSMMGRPDLSDIQVNQIIAYLRAAPIENPIRIDVDESYVSKGDSKLGAEKYKLYCAYCHGDKGEGYSAGGPGPAIGLKGFLSTACDDYIMQTVLHGRMDTAMKSFNGAKGVANLSKKDIDDIIVFLRKLK